MTRGDAYGDAWPLSRGHHTDAHTSLTVIAGGLGAVGQMLHRELGSELGQIVDLDLRDARSPGDITMPGALERDLLRSADTVVLAIPEPVALAASVSLTELMSPDSLLIETLSVKTRFAAAIEAGQPAFEVVGINPMFGPSLGIDGRAVALVPYIVGERAAALVSLIAESGGVVTELSAEAHDRTTAALQVLPHLVILGFAKALSSCELDLGYALRLAPPPASAVLALAARIAGGNQRVYSEIQMSNPFAECARRSLVEAVTEVIEATAETDLLGELLNDVAEEFGDAYPDLLLAAERLARHERPLLEPGYPAGVKRG